MTFRQSLLNSTGSRGARLLSLCLLIGSPRGFTAFAADVKSSALLNPSLVSTGLRNLGNTCYMNAQLQCAFHIPGIRQIAIMEEEEKVAQADQTDPVDSDCEEVDEEDSTTASTLSSDPPSDALLALRELFEDMVKASDQQFSAAVQPRSFCVRLGIPVMVQQDSQEFWKLLLPAVNKEALSDLYKGSFEDYITALDGSGRERRREELFLDLSLDISSSTTLLDSLKSSFGEPELLSVAEGNGWRPEKGADKVDAHKGCTLIAKGLPPILQFHLKRFNYDWQTDTMTKLNNRFSFPDELNLSSVCKTVDPGEKELVVYDLQSVVIHMGEYGVGHYYSYIRPDIQSNTWYRFNDDIVEEVPFQEVMDDAFGGKSSASSPKKNKQQGGLFRRLTRILQGGPGNIYGWGGRTSNAYVVQYVRRCDRPMLYPE